MAAAPAPASPALTAFIRDLLGCGCPPEVFERVDETPSAASRRAGVARRIDVGGRLLIYIAGSDTPDLARSRLPDWIAAGRAERDATGMNRLRLVIALAGDDPAALEPIRTAFATLAGSDERLHLHLVRPEQLPPP